MSKFNSLSEMCKAIVLKHTKGIDDERLVKSTGQNEGTNADGGYLVTQDLMGPLLSGLQQASVILPKTKQLRTTGYGVKIPVVYETTRKNGGSGNMNAYWVGEGVAKTDDKVAVGQLSLKMHKLFCVMYITEEMLADAVYFNDFIDAFIAEKIAWQIDRAAMLGDGNTSMFGVMGPSSVYGTIGVAAANPLDEATLENYVKALAPAARNGAEWYMSQENFNDIIDIDFTQDDTLHYFEGVPYLFGFRINIMEQLSDPCQDLMLGDYGQYVVVMQGGIEKAINLSLKYLEDEQCIRWGLRLNGAVFGQAYQLEDTTDVATFVIPDCSPKEASSSSSSESDLNFSSSSTSSKSSKSESSSTEDRPSGSSSSSKSLSSDTSSSSSSKSLSSNTSSSSSSRNYSESSDTSSSSSQSGLGGCAQDYCASLFTTVALNGTYYATGGVSNSKPVYKNATYYLWNDPVSNYWAISGNVGDPQNQWLTSSDTATACPAGPFTREDGTLAIGKC